MSEMIRAVELARELRVRPSLAYRLPLSRLDEAIKALSPALTAGAVERTLVEAKERKCGMVLTAR